MFNIRPEQHQDIMAIRTVNNLAFKGEGEAKLVEAIRASAFFVPELSLVAVTNEGAEVIGHVMFSTISIETSSGTVPTLGLAPMAVSPDYQQQGIGSALIRAGLKKCEELGYEHVVVLGHPDYYPKFGFVPAHTKGIACPFPVPAEVFMVLETKSGSLSGINGTVQYPPAFNAV
ncbi:GNAT family N-acetyltransferase [Paenibacillus sp. 481]|uniref:GNAT family N-acetyltransferase n=1 Tax=Paenibacillus sp. 481 TaxID=2835869 RepID=UPI001E420C36|nr:N-acetyltransferase [Paenibacillus sp. 481]